MGSEESPCGHPKRSPLIKEERGHMFAEVSARVAPIKQVKTSHKVHSSRMMLFWANDQSDSLFVYFIFGIGVEC